MRGVGGSLKNSFSAGIFILIYACSSSPNSFVETPAQIQKNAALLTALTGVEAGLQGPKINEFVADRTGGDPDWIELYNPNPVGSKPIDLSNWYLSDSVKNIKKYQIPAGTILCPAGTAASKCECPAEISACVKAVGYMIVYANSSNRVAGSPRRIYTNFSLSAEGESLVLSDPTGEVSDFVSFANQVTNTSYGRPNNSGNFTFLANTSAGSANGGELATTSTKYPSLPNFVINEWMASSNDGTSDWLELLYKTGPTVRLDAYRFKYEDDAGATRYWVPPAGTTLCSLTTPAINCTCPTLNPNCLKSLGYVSIWLDGGTGTQPGLHAPFKLNRKGDEITLETLDGDPYDYVSFLSQGSGFSQGRFPQKSGPEKGYSPFVYFLRPSKDSPNSSDLPAPVARGSMLINEILAEGVTDADNWVEIKNISSSPIKLSQYAISDDPADFNKYVFPASTPDLQPGEYRVVTLDACETNCPPLHANFRLSRSGGVLRISHITGVEIDSLIFPSQAKGYTYGRVVDGSVFSFLNSSTPGARNSDMIPLRGVGAIFINEWMASNTRTSPSNPADGTYDDWIEITNSSSSSVDLSGYQLSDNEINFRKFTFPTGTVLAPNSYLVIWADGGKVGPGLHASFGLSKDDTAGTLLLSHPAGTVIHQVQFGAQYSDTSMGRPLSTGTANVFLSNPTPGGMNSPELATGINPKAPPKPPTATALINEWMAKDLSGDDWFEIYNNSAKTINLSGYRLSDDAMNLNKFTIPAIADLPAGGYLRIWADGMKPGAGIHASFFLSAMSGQIVLSHPDGTVLNLVSYATQGAGVSQGRSPSGGASIVYFQTPSPEGNNNIAMPSKISAGAVKISEWMAQNSDGDDWFEITNATGQTLSLGGYQLSDSATELNKFSLPAGTTLCAVGAATCVCPAAYPNCLKSTGYLLVWAGTKTTPAGIHTPFSLSDESGKIIISYPDGSIIDQVSYGTQSANLSQGLLANGSIDFLRTPSPGGINGPVFPPPMPTNTIIINEWMASNKASVKNPADLAYDDWLEIYNPSASATLDLSFYQIAVTSDSEFFTFPQGTLLPPKGFLVIWADGGKTEATSPPKALHAKFKLERALDRVTIKHPNGTVVSGVDFHSQVEDISQGRYVDGNLYLNRPNFPQYDFLSHPTPGAPNLPPVTDVRPGSLVLNEWMARNENGPKDPADRKNDDWIEIYNPSPQVLSLTGYQLFNVNSEGEEKTFVIPSGTRIEPFGYLIIWADEETNQNITGKRVHANFKLDAVADYLELRHPTGTVLDSFDIADVQTDQVQGRFYDGDVSAQRTLIAPTPGEPNVMALPGLSADLIRLYPHLSSGMVRQKAMRVESTFEFFRAFIPYFFDLAQKWRLSLPLIDQSWGSNGWCAGDPHPENFGAILDRNGQARFVINDTDDAGPCVSLALDTLRFMVGALLKEPQTDLVDLFAAYRDGLEGVNKTAGYREWLSDLLSESNRDGMRPQKSYVNYGGMLGGKPSLKRLDDIVEVDEKTKNQIRRAVFQLFGFQYQVIDIVQKVRLTGGSSGLVRYEALMSPVGGSGGLAHLEFKQIAIPGMFPILSGAMPDSPFRLFMTLLTEQMGMQVPIYSVHRIGRFDMLMRPRFAGNNPASNEHIDEDDWEDVLLTEAWELGALHARSAENITAYKQKLNTISIIEWMKAARRMIQHMQAAFYHSRSMITSESLVYSEPDVAYSTNTIIVPNAAFYKSTKKAGTYSVSPDLPAGLKLNSKQGWITGTPSEVSARQKYTISVSGNEQIKSEIYIKVDVNTTPEPPEPPIAEPQEGIIISMGSEIIRPYRADQHPEIDLGAGGYGTQTTEREFTIKNMGQTQVEIKSVQLTTWPPMNFKIPVPSKLIGFSLTDKPSGAYLQPGEKITFKIKLDTTYPGSKSGLVAVNYHTDSDKIYGFRIGGLVYGGGAINAPKLEDWIAQQNGQGSSPMPAATSSSAPSPTPIINAPTSTHSPSPSPGSTGAVEYDYIDPLMTLGLPNEYFTQPGAELLTLATTSTKAGFLALRPKLSKEPITENILRYLSYKGTLGTKLSDLLIAAKHSDFSLGAKIAMRDAAESLRGDAEAVVTLTKEFMKKMWNDEDGRHRAIFLLLVAKIPGIHIWLKNYSYSFLSANDVKNLENTNAMGRIRLRAMMVRAYLSTYVPMQEALALLIPIMRKIDSISRAPILDEIFMNYPEVAIGVTEEELKAAFGGEN